MSENNDPRVYFAAERTLLAWVRTGLTVIGLGFVVARFNLFLRVIRQDHSESGLHISTAIGVALVILGAAAIGMAAWQHTRFTSRLDPKDRPEPYQIHWAVWFAGCIAGIGIILAVYLAVRANPA